MSAIPLILLYLLVALIPLILAAIADMPPRPVWDDLASGAGMVAFSVLLIEFLLSGRYRIVSRKIGMDTTMRFHQLLARTALALAIVHPFLYSLPQSLPLPWDPSRQYTLIYDLESMSSGIAAWVLLGALVPIAVGRTRLDYSYETWRLLHGVGALLVAGLTMHHALMAGRYSDDPILIGFWSVLISIAFLSLMSVYIVKALLQLRRPWYVESVEPAALGTWKVVIAPVKHHGLCYEAGQFAWLKVGSSPFTLAENPFSISSAPASSNRLEFLIKELGDFSRSLGAVKPGTRAYVDGPHGNLVVAGRHEPGIAFIAGGVGIAPLLGQLRQLHLCGDTRPTLLVYGNRRLEQIIEPDELEALTHAQNTRFVPVLSEPPPGWDGRTGLVDRGLISDLMVPEMRAWLFVTCGPTAMLEGIEDALIAAGVPARQILSERFDYD
jgi:predicted ferric reductase